MTASIDRMLADPSQMPPELLEAMMEGYRRKVRGEFLAWCEHCLAPMDQKPAAHHRLIIQELQDVADGRCNRLMIFMPPGSAKSTYASVFFPAGSWLVAAVWTWLRPRMRSTWRRTWAGRPGT